MTAAVLTKFGGPEVPELHHDWPRPWPAAHEVLVKVTAAAVNNTDLWTRQGGDICPQIGATFPLTSIADAQAEFSARRHIGKIVLLPE
jgi:NADPH:quinone reductase-like Zn-dependent oxidoreductase